jgi:Protein phosphatase 2C
LIGATHAVCQDYAIAGPRLTKNQQTTANAQIGPYVLVSDGCSSSVDTDVGARLLIKAAERLLVSSELISGIHLPDIHKLAASTALAHAEAIGICPEAVDATLLTVHLCGEQAIAGCSGDGVVVLQSRTGAIDIYTISYTSGYPFYPSYAHQPGRLRAMVDKNRARKEVKHFRRSANGEPFALQNISASGAVTEVFAVTIEEYNLVALFSDGIHSFSIAQRTETSRRTQPIPMEEVIPELLSLKSTNGAFVRRRTNRFMKDCKAKGWQNSDDLAAAMMYMGD